MTTRADNRDSWLPPLGDIPGPAYLAIADALAADIRAGRLAPGDPLPTQRELAEQLGINFTTVTRAYTEARRRGLITATVGRGTFVAGPHLRPLADPSRTADHDLSVNAPPVPSWLPAAFRTTLGDLAARPALARNVVTYESRLGDDAAREVGALWLRDRGLVTEASRVIATAGAQHALTLALSALARAGDTVLTEELAYPGLHSAARALGVQLVGVRIDNEGLDPDSLDAACKRYRPSAIFCVPTSHNPTTAVMSAARRQQIVDIARRYHVCIVEDDICGPLFPNVTPLAAIAPDLVMYIGSLSKCVAPGLRTAFVLAPSAADASRLDASLRASLLMMSPLVLAVSCAWITDGTAARAIADIRAEAIARGRLALHMLGSERISVPAGSIHAWLRLPEPWTVASFVAAAQQQRVRVAPSDWYITAGSGGGGTPPAATRLTLGAEANRSDLEDALSILAAILDQPIGLRASTI